MTIREMHAREIPSAVLWVCKTLHDRGHGAWVVGGCVRDHLLGRKVADWDICTSATPEQVVATFPRTVPTGIAHGTVTVVHQKEHFEVTTLRGEGAYSDGRRPDSVFFVDDITADLARRDFTVNAIAFDPLRDALVDPHGGLHDLERRLIRAVGNPRERFGEDGLRVLRGARFVASLEFELDAETEAAIAPSIDTFRRVSVERIHDEWVKTMKANKPSRAFDVMSRTGLLSAISPVLGTLACHETTQASFRHSLAAMDLLAPGETVLRMAALLHDMTGHAQEADGSELSARRAEDLLKHLRFSNDERNAVVHLIRHQQPLPSLTDDVRARHFLAVFLRAPDDRDKSLDALDIWLRFVSALARARGENDASVKQIEHHVQRMSTMVRDGIPLHPRMLSLSGNDLQRELSIPPSKRLGEILAQLFRWVLDDPARNERARLLEHARTLYGTPPSTP